VVVAEGNGGTKTVTFVLTLSAPSGQNVTVNYSTADGTASAASGDYVAKAGTVTFGPGSTSQTVTVTLNGDMVLEGDETFFLNLVAVTGGVLVDNQAVATVVGDETPVATLTTTEVPWTNPAGHQPGNGHGPGRPLALPPEASARAEEVTDILGVGRRRRS
jgi:hypothetical protein